MKIPTARNGEQSTKSSATMTLFNFGPATQFDHAVPCASACRRAHVVIAYDGKQSFQAMEVELSVVSIMRRCVKKCRNIHGL